MLPILPLAGLAVEGVKWVFSSISKEREEKRSLIRDKMAMHKARIESTNNSWKDELITIWVLLIVTVYIVSPFLSPHTAYKIQRSMELIGNIPEPMREIFQLTVLTGIGAEMISKGAKGFFKS